MERFIHPSKETSKILSQWKDTGPVCMLNLLKFKEVANYEPFPALAPNAPISGEEAYQRYMKAVNPLLEKAGSEILYFGGGNSFVIGPSNETWDLVILVKHKSVPVFLDFAASEAYQKIAGHRTAALEDSRLLPSTAL